MSTILLVEDELLLGEVIRDTLVESGYSVILARNGKEGILSAKTKIPDLAILDMKLPDIDGLDLIKEIKHIHPSLPIIMHTAYEHFQDSAEVEGKVDAYLIKPVSLQKLKSKIEEIAKEREKWIKLEKKINILDFMSHESIIVNLKGTTKEESITELTEHIARTQKIDNFSSLLESLLAREKTSSTGVGEGVAIPHTRFKGISKIITALGISEKGVDFNALDGKPVHLVFVLIIPDDENGIHTKALVTARICFLAKNKAFTESLLKARTPDKVIGLIKEYNTVQ